MTGKAGLASTRSEYFTMAVTKRAEKMSATAIITPLFLMPFFIKSTILKVWLKDI
jgi:hypothetical protein